MIARLNDTTLKDLCWFDVLMCDVLVAGLTSPDTVIRKRSSKQITAAVHVQPSIMRYSRVKAQIKITR